MSLNCSRLFLFSENELSMRWSTPSGRLEWQVPCQMGNAWPWHQSPLTLWATPGPQQQTSCVTQWPAPIASQKPFYHIDLLSQEHSWVSSCVFEQPGVGGVPFIPQLLAESTLSLRTPCGKEKNMLTQSRSSQDSSVPGEDYFSVFKAIELWLNSASTKMWRDKKYILVAMQIKY